MESSNNNISWEVMLSSIVGLMFFAPLVEKNIKFDSSFTQEEKDFITWYIQVWYVNLAFLIIVLLTTFINIFWIQPYLSRVITIWSIVIYIITIFSIITCANSVSMRNSNEKAVQKIQNKWQILKSYIPIINFYLWFCQEDYDTIYWWLKESILLRTIFIFGTLLFWVSFWLWILIIIVFRVLLLLLNVDFVPISIKKFINNTFSCNPEEIFAYISSNIKSKINKIEYTTVLQTNKLSYKQWQDFWIWILIQYILFIGIVFLLYRWFNLSIWNILILIALLLGILRVVIFYLNKKKFLKIPILSELVSLVFN